MGIMGKVHIVVLGVPNNRLTCMQGQKSLALSYNMHLFWPYLLNDSQTIRPMIHFSKPLLCVTTVANSRETNKQPQLQKQAQNKPNIFLWFIIINIIYYQ